MTVKLAKPVTKKRASRKPAASDVVALVLRKPTDEDALLRVAEELCGRPVPGLRMTEKQYVDWWDENVNAEWVDGEVILMPPVNVEQDDLRGWLSAILRCFLEDKDAGRSFGPEFSIRFSRQRRWRVPDNLVVLKHRLHLVQKTCVNGAPDMAFEIVSPDSVVRDWREKYQEYQSAGVREYWVIDPTTRRFDAYALRGKTYHLIDEDEDEDGRTASRVLKGFFLREEWLWKQPLPRVSSVLRELGVSAR